MTLWFVFALMTAVAIFAVLWPLGQRKPQPGGSDVAVYRDQLDEIERDHASGMIGEQEAAAARVEVSRRLIAAADAETAVPAGGDPLWRRRATALFALVALPVFAGGLYVTLGSPDLPGQPQASRSAAPAGQDSVAELVARVEAHLESNPDDGRGWEVLAPVYARANRYADAVKARRNVLRLLGANAEREAGLGEALTGAAGGVVTAEAKEAFERALSLDASEFRARYYLGLAAEQDGRRDDAAAIWKALLASVPADLPVADFLRQSLARVDPAAAVAATGPPARGPSAEDVAAAAELSPEQRNAMVRGMVERLADRLKQETTDVEGWLRLLRAYMVLGEPDKARDAARDARRALAGEPDKLQRVNELVKRLGFDG
jgi:cytochrome c-type biogenesis protein CcmH